MVGGVQHRVLRHHLRDVCVSYIGVVSVFSQYMVYNCVYYCDTYRFKKNDMHFM
jgi:hypothetical protein